jgi:TonB family protein
MIYRLQWKMSYFLLAITVSFASTVLGQEPKGAEPQPPKIIRKSGGVLQGSATKRVQPTYPPLAKAARVSGSVVVEVTVDEEGRVIAARAISGHPLLKDAAVAAARGWTFASTMLQGVPVKVIGTITFNFHLVSQAEIEAAREKVNANPASAEMHYRLAQLFQDDAQLESAIEEYRQALALDADYVEAYQGLGRTYSATGHLEEAIDVYKHGLSVKSLPGFAETLNIDLGKAYGQLDRNEEALDSLKRAVEINPDSVEGHFNLGLTFLRIGDKESAMKEFTILKDLSEDRADTLRRLIKKDD